MKLTDIVAAQVKTARDTAADLQRVTRTAADLARPSATFNTRIARVETRIKALERQKADTIKRLDEAIAEQTKLRDRLVKDSQNITSRIPDIKDAPGRPTPGRRPSGSATTTIKKTTTKAAGERNTATVKAATKAKIQKKQAAARRTTKPRKPRGG